MFIFILLDNVLKSNGCATRHPPNVYPLLVGAVGNVIPSSYVHEYPLSFCSGAVKLASFPAFQFNIIVFAVHLAFNVAGPVVVCSVALSHCGELPNVSENVGNVSIDNIKAMQRLPVCVCVCV